MISFWYDDNDQFDYRPNYWPVSIFLICEKAFEKIIFNWLFVHSNYKNLLNSNQSKFRPGVSCVNQLISITHEICKAFDANTSLEVKGVFLDLSKAFDKNWHDHLLYKLKRIEIYGNFGLKTQLYLTDSKEFF